ncbi:hypothetical protein ACQBAU_06035 [Propionibacteriaceae bacterium Y2011]|uniref:hypothetical protein n=1 Tax=Microlunatus sp. Y2014 TaxID=3418488 RepID=UPI003B46A5DE
MSDAKPADKPVTVLVYSDDRAVRDDVRRVLGAKVAADLPPIEVVEVATHPAVTNAMDTGTIDIAVFDGEATPAGGMGLSRQMHDEIFECPPIVVMLARPDDAWLANWSRAEGVVGYPLDPIRLPKLVAELLRERLGVGTAGSDVVSAP